MNGRAGSDPKPVIPSLGRYYGLTSDIAYLIVRLTVGLMLLPHGWTKVVTGITGVSGYFARLHLEPAWLFTIVSMFNETIGGVLDRNRPFHAVHRRAHCNRISHFAVLGSYPTWLWPVGSRS